MKRLFYFFDFFLGSGTGLYISIFLDPYSAVSTRCTQQHNRVGRGLVVFFATSHRRRKMKLSAVGHLGSNPTSCSQVVTTLTICAAAAAQQPKVGCEFLFCIFCIFLYFFTREVAFQISRQMKIRIMTAIANKIK